MKKLQHLLYILYAVVDGLTNYSFFAQWPRFRVKHLLELVCSKAELHATLLLEPEVNQKQFRPGKHWN